MNPLMWWATKFQLTHLLRGATHSLFHLLQAPIYFNSRTSCEVRLVNLSSFYYALNFNSRTSCEVRLASSAALSNTVDFNSRTSCEVRLRPPAAAPRPPISTHAPLARCDIDAPETAGRQQLISTHAPLARCDRAGRRRGRLDVISTHAPLARCDNSRRKTNSRYNHFNSRTSCEVRHFHHEMLDAILEFQLTHLLRGATFTVVAGKAKAKFQLTHLLRGAT